MSIFFKELSVEHTTKQRVLVDSLTEDAPFLESMPLEESTHGLHHVFEKIDAITGGNITAIDAARAVANQTTGLDNITLSIIAGVVEQGIDSAVELGGFDAVIRKKLPKIIRKTGMEIERDIIYNSFRSFANTESKLVSGGGSASANYTILAITWREGEMGGLFDKNVIATQNLFRLLRYANGGILLNSSSKPVFQLDFTAVLGILTANEDLIAGIVNNDISADDPVGTRTFATIKQMDAMLRSARRNASTRIYCHPAVQDYLGTIYKAGQVRHDPVPTSGFEDRIPTWNGTPIISSFNFDDGDETTVSL